MLSLVTFYYNSWEALMWQKDDLIGSNLDIVIVDDCSPNRLSIEWANVFRLKEDIFFNLDAVNLGVIKANGENIFRFDLDHKANYKSISEIEIPNNTIFQFNRFDTYGKKLKPNPSHILIKKEDFIKIGGWNTKYSGNYGMCDNDFIRRSIKMGYSIEISDIELIVNPNLGTKGIERNTSINKEIFMSNPECNTNWDIDYEVVNLVKK